MDIHPGRPLASQRVQNIADVLGGGGLVPGAIRLVPPVLLYNLLDQLKPWLIRTLAGGVVRVPQLWSPPDHTSDHSIMYCDPPPPTAGAGTAPQTSGGTHWQLHTVTLLRMS